MGQDQFCKYLTMTRDYVYFDFLGGPKVLPMRHTVNLFKSCTFLWVIFLMSLYQNYSTGMFLYLFLHGSYGICWCIKQIYFPDATFKQKATIGSHCLISVLLLMYWCIPMSIVLGYGIQEPTKGRIAVCVGMYLLGIYLMMGSDYQKTKTLAIKKGLISSGFFSITRNPNYLGEIMIYGSFALTTGYWTSYAIVLFVWSTLFATNIYLKDQLSYKKKSGWEEYRNKSYILLPKFFSNSFANLVSYISIFMITHAIMQYWE